MDKYSDDSDNLIEEDSALSFRGFTRKNLFGLLDDNLKVKSENIFLTDSDNTLQIEKVISEMSGVDICFGDIGINDHIVFNEAMDEKLIKANKFKSLKNGGAEYFPGYNFNEQHKIWRAY